MVTVECPSYPEVTEGVLSEMRDNMPVMEYRMESWLIRIRDLDTAEMSSLLLHISHVQQHMNQI